jgi:hypothetical protein
MKSILLLLTILAGIPLVYAHMPPRDQALIIVKEANGYKFEFLIFPKKPQAGTITELVLNATYLKDGWPYTGGVAMGVEAVDADNASQFEILEFGAEKKDEGSAVQYDAGHYEITAIFSTNGTYAVNAWPAGDRAKSVTAEFLVHPRSEPNTLLFGALGAMVLLFLVVGYLLTRR